MLEQHASTLISDEQFKLRARAFPWKTPETKVKLRFTNRAAIEKFMENLNETNVVETIFVEMIEII